MSQNGKYQLLIPVVLIAGVWWFNHRTESVALDKAAPVEHSEQTQTNKTLMPATAANAQTKTQAVQVAAATKDSTILKFTPRLQRQVEYLAMMMTRPDVEIPELAMQTSHLNSEEIQQLGQAVLDSSNNDSVRSASVFLLSKAGPQAIPALGMITTSSIIATGTSEKAELSLRITALEALDKMTGNSSEVLPILDKTIDTQKNKTLVFLASLSAGGIRSGRPGKLTRAMDQIIKEKSL